jgi:hypothetical protein
MKTFFAALALAALITVQAFGPATAAPNNQRDGYSQQKDGCMYEGYPCYQWRHSGEDMW